MQNKVQRKARVAPGKNHVDFFFFLKQKTGLPSGTRNLNIFLSSCFVPIGSLFLSPWSSPMFYGSREEADARPARAAVLTHCNTSCED